MAHELTARILSQPGIEAYYSFFGTPYVTVIGPRGDLNVDLNELAQTAYDFYQSRNKNTAMDYIVAGYLVGKIHNLYGLADAQIQRANCITRFFINIRGCISSCLAYIEIFQIRQLYQLHYVGESIVEIPTRLVSQNPFLTQNLPAQNSEELDDIDSEDGSIMGYDPAQITAVFDRFLAQGSNPPARA
ncbi:MAG: hypothetical protein ACHQT8_04800 [Chlamydiales bacterium]